MRVSSHRAWSILATLAILVLTSLGLYKAVAGGTPDQVSRLSRIQSMRHVFESSSDPALLLVVRDGCLYCAQSMPFYRSLSAQRSRSKPHGARIIAVVLRKSASQNPAEYVARHQIDVDEVIGVSSDELSRLGIRGTPTVILASPRGDVLNRWVGRLDTESQRKVIDLAFP